MLEIFKKRTQHLNYGRDIITRVVMNHANRSEKNSLLKILDLGAGSGVDLINSKEAAERVGVNVKLYGIEGYGPNVAKLKKAAIEVYNLDLEEAAFPFENEMFDIIITNQCIEHTKEVFWIFGEISRVLKPHGICIVGVPNLASLHNRLLLLFGFHPTSIRMFGPHVRGITKRDFILFAEKGGYFKCKKAYGSNFYPFPPFIAKILSKIFPGGSVSLFFILERTKKEGVFSSILEEVFFETPYRH